MVFRWFLWVRQIVCVCVCVCVRERERERERGREIWSWFMCFACFLCLCLSEFHSCCKFFDASITMSEEKIYHVLIHVSTPSHGSECMNMIHVIPPVSEKGERDQSETCQPYQIIVFIIA